MKHCQDCPHKAYQLSLLTEERLICTIYGAPLSPCPLRELTTETNASEKKGGRPYAY